jgi:hypothetical protein
MSPEVVSMSRTERVSIGAVMIALGITLPMAFHAVGLGPTFLPMHLPVLMAALLVDPAVACLVGMVTPLLSALLTGMPALMPPIAQAMVIELGLYGLLGSLIHQRLGQDLYVSLIGAMLGGRVAYGLLGATILPLIGLRAVPLLYPVTAGLVASLPGILIQLAIVPVIVRGLQKGVPSLRRRAVQS